MSDSDPREDIERIRRQLSESGRESSQVPFKADRDHLLKMSDNIRLVPSKIGHYRHRAILKETRRIATLAEWPTVQDFRENGEVSAAGVESTEDIEALLQEQGILGLALEYRAAAEAIVRWIHDEYTNEHSNQDHRSAIRAFGKYRLKREDPPESLAWIPTTTSNSFNPVPSERDLLIWEDDVFPMIEAARNPRDKALFAVQFEAGCRSGELFDLRVGDVFDTEHTVGIHVDGKQGERPVHLWSSVSYLQQWLTEHPGGEGDYLWSKLSSPERPSYTTWNNYFKDAADRAGVSKNVTATNFRKSNTRWLVNKGLSQPRIEDRQGRERGSDHTRRYIARFGEESNERAYLSLYDENIETESPDEFGPIECPRCGQNTPREGKRCMGCGFAFSEEVIEETEEKRRAAFSALTELMDEGELNPDEASQALNDLISQRVQAALNQHHS